MWPIKFMRSQKGTGTLGNRNRSHWCILAKNQAMSCHVCPENLSEAELKRHGLINLVKGIRRLNGIESGAWLLLAAYSKSTKGIKNKKWSKKMWKTVVCEGKTWAHLQPWRARGRQRSCNVQEISTVIGKRPMGARPCPSEASGCQNANVFERSGESVWTDHITTGVPFSTRTT